MNDVEWLSQDKWVMVRDGVRDVVMDRSCGSCRGRPVQRQSWIDPRKGPLVAFSLPLALPCAGVVLQLQLQLPTRQAKALTRWRAEGVARGDTRVQPDGNREYGIGNTEEGIIRRAGSENVAGTVEEIKVLGGAVTPAAHEPNEPNEPMGRGTAQRSHCSL